VGMQPALEQRFDVARHHADAVRIVAGEIGHHQVLGDQLRFAGLAAAGRGDRLDRGGQVLLLENHHSALMFPLLTTRVQRSTSAFLNAPNSSGELATTSKPIWLMRSATSGERSAFTIAPFRRATTAFGVFAGAAAACHDVTTRSPNPASPTDGTSGSCGWRAFAVTASAFMRLPLMWLV